MQYRKNTNLNIISIYKSFYKTINGGIDGYYERMILDAQIYEICTTEPNAYFSVHPERGLTSLVVLPPYMADYDKYFTYVLGLPLFTNVLFSGNDQLFLGQIIKNNLPYEIQAYNFDIKKMATSSIQMKIVTKENMAEVKEVFRDFIEYNHISLEHHNAFYYEKDGHMISFGSLVPLRLNNRRYCLAMIVHADYRRQGYGCETVKFLISYLQLKNLEANARCYVLNEASRRTLLKSGFVISNYLYKAHKEESIR